MALCSDPLTPSRPGTASLTGPSTSNSEPQSPFSNFFPIHNNQSPTTTMTSIDFFASPSTWKFQFYSQRASPVPQSRHRSISRRALRWIMLSLCVTLAIFFYQTIPSQRALDLLTDDLTRETNDISSNFEPAPNHASKTHAKLSPEEWIKQHSHAPNTHPPPPPSRPRAALISLVRNSELPGILQSMRQLEYYFNRHHNYPWHFFSESPFTPHFINFTTSTTSAPTHYHLIPRPHWSIPASISLPRFHQSLSYLGSLGVGKGHMPSYRHMCRWNSGFFYHHPALHDYDYYWRVEPDVHFFCDIPYDPFAFFQAFGMVYGFNMAILEDARSFPSLWPATLDFVSANPELVHRDADVSWLLDGGGGGDGQGAGGSGSGSGGYNNCQFFSNFEIGDLNFFRGNNSKSSGRWGDMGRANDRYFEYLDQMGGFFYERFGDAPIHTLSVSLFAPRDKVWWFGDVGYQHDIARVCPKEGSGGVKGGVGRCMCEETRLDENFYKLVPMESPQRKPGDTCLRMWLEGRDRGEGGVGKGGGWLEKKQGWDREAEMALGGDGYGGYVREG